MIFNNLKLIIFGPVSVLVPNIIIINNIIYNHRHQNIKNKQHTFFIVILENFETTNVKLTRKLRAGKMIQLDLDSR